MFTLQQLSVALYRRMMEFHEGICLVATYSWQLGFTSTDGAAMRIV